MPQQRPQPPGAVRRLRLACWPSVTGAASVALATAAIVAGVGDPSLQSAAHVEAAAIDAPVGAGPAGSTLETAYEYTQARWDGDLAAMQAFRPGYSFWQHIFTIPDGAIAYGSAIDGRLLAVFPAKGDWARQGTFVEPSLATLLAARTLPLDLGKRRDEVAQWMESVVGPVVHNPTRGGFLTPGARRYGAFLQQWGAIYERFGVPAEIGLAQALLESGFDGRRRSRAGAIGFCQWLAHNWKVLDRLAPATIEAQNQTTQAPYCAAYLTILATKHAAFIPALSAHHSGGTNVARTLINGERLGGIDIRERYFLGAQLARDLRLIALGTYRDLYGSYGPRSYRYAEMTFGNTITVTKLMAATPQLKVHAMRTTRPLAVAEIARRAKVSEDEVRRFNPALVRRVPAGATLYLPTHVPEFGRDVAFWQRPPAPAFVSVLNEFVRLDTAGDAWDDPSFATVLREFERRFQATKTEEGSVMATVIAYAIQEMYASGRGNIIREFRTRDEIRLLFERGVRERDAVRLANSAGAPQ